MIWKIKSFKELNVEELYEIFKIRNEVFVVEQNCIYQDCDDKDKNAYHLFLDDEGEIIAYLRILEKGISYDEISLGRVAVSKKHRGNGIAKEMILKAIEFVEKTLTESEIKIAAQAYLLNFYKNLGFKQVSDIYLADDNIEHVKMLYKSHTM